MGVIDAKTIFWATLYTRSILTVTLYKELKLDFENLLRHQRRMLHL